MASRYTARRERLHTRMRDCGLDAVVLASGPNCAYLTGFAGEQDRWLLVLLTGGDGPVAFTADQYVGQVRANDEIGTVVGVDANTPDAVTNALLAEIDGLDGLVLDENATAAVTTRLVAGVDGDVGLAGPLLEPMRLRKDEVELDTMRRAAAIADAVSEELRALGPEAIGMTERDLVVEIRARLHAKGGERLAFPVSVGAGPNGARPTAYRHGDREIEAGDPVVLDFGTVVDGYASDQTRTCVFAGDPPTGFETAFAAAKAGLDAGVGAVEPGVGIASVDRAVRAAIAEYGLEEHFTHGTGHGVGLDAHEPPAITGASDRTLREGMVFSIEPGIYVPGEYGVRLEDLVVVTDSGCQRLNASPYTWRPL